MTLQRFFLALGAALAAGLLFHSAVRAALASDGQPEVMHVYATAPRDDAAAAAAFAALIPVLRHPRCMNCHSRGDFPRQGDDGHRHTMNVRRGPEGNGVAAVKCSSCHQEHNLEGFHMPPGAPGWHLPPPQTPMIWEGLTDRQLCDLFKNPRENGNRSVDAIVEHMTTPLVLWGWNPGEGRTPVPLSQAEFLERVKEWAAKGAACPGFRTASDHASILPSQ
jgi:hypothetical protein